MRKGWEYKMLGELGTLTSSKRIFKSEYVSEGVPFYRSKEIKELGNGTDISMELYITKERYSEIKERFGVPQKGDILLTAVGTIGEMYVVDDSHDFYFKDGNIMWLKNFSFLDSYFLKYALTLFVEQLKAMSQGSAYSALTIEKLKKYSIPIPPLHEQKQIVAILDQAFAAIDQAKANIERNIQNAKELFQSKLNEIFSQKGDGWEEKRMDEVCEIKSKLINPEESKYQNRLHVGGGNIIAESGELIELKTAKEEGLKSGKFAFTTQVVLYNKIRPYLVKVTRPDFEGLCSADMYPLTPNKEEITKDFLYFLLISKRFTDYAIAGSARAGMPKVNRKHLFEYTFSLPSVVNQELIIKDLDALRIKSHFLDTVYVKRFANLEELKKSILQKAFAGELNYQVLEELEPLSMAAEERAEYN